MKRWPWLLIGTLFLVCDLVVAGLVYFRLDPGAAHAALRQLNLTQQATNAPVLPKAPKLPTVRVSSKRGLVRVQGSVWRVDMWEPHIRVEMAVGDGFTWPDHRNARRQHLVLPVFEANRTGGALHFRSSAQDFALVGSDKIFYAETPGFFNSYNVSRMHQFENLPPGGKNVGDIAFDIPVRRGTYMILWKESKATRWFPIATVAVGPGHKPIVSSSS